MSLLVRARDDRKGTPGITELSRARAPIDPAVCYLKKWGRVVVIPTRALANIGETYYTNWVGNSKGSGKMKDLNDIQKQLVIGSILGDGHLRGKDEKLFEFSQTERRLFYVKWKHDMLKNIASPIYRFERGPSQWAYKFTTKTNHYFTELYRVFYRNGRKVVPRQIGKMLTPFSVAVWFMDDGSKSRNSVYFNTQAFSISEQMMLVKALKRFYVIANVNKDKEWFRLRVLNRCNENFLKVFGPHILREFLYKLPTP